jgi:hypothetical protein
MKSKGMVIGAVCIGCLSAGLISAASAQDANTKGGHAQVNGAVHNGKPAGANGQFDARAGGERGSAGDRFNVSERRGEGRFGNEGRNFAEERTMRNEEGRYGRGQRGERALYAYAGTERYGRSWRGNRLAYRPNGADVAAERYPYRTRRLYAYSPAYEAGYSVGSYYDYAPTYSYDVGATATPYYYGPGWDVAYGGPYYGPDVGVGIGIGPIGVGIGPAWAW